MKKEIIGIVVSTENYKGEWAFKTKEKSYDADVCCALDEILGFETKEGQKFKIVIEEIL